MFVFRILLTRLNLGYQNIRILCLFRIFVAIHGVSLSTSCLTIDKYGCVESRQYLLDEVIYLCIAIYGMLSRVVIKNLVEAVVLCIVVTVIHDSKERISCTHKTYLILHSSETARFSLL